MPLTQAEKNALTADGGYQTSQKDRQTIAITDIISEGPIYGLVDGAASVYLNDDRVVPLAQAASSRQRFRNCYNNWSRNNSCY